MIVTLVQISVSSNRTGKLCFDPLTVAVLEEKKKPIYRNTLIQVYNLDLKIWQDHTF